MIERPQIAAFHNKVLPFVIFYVSLRDFIYIEAHGVCVAPKRGYTKINKKRYEHYKRTA